jgi:hypothetical protein
MINIWQNFNTHLLENQHPFQEVVHRGPARTDPLHKLQLRDTGLLAALAKEGTGLRR